MEINSELLTAHGVDTLAMHRMFNIKTKYSDWIRRLVCRYYLIKGVDYIILPKKSSGRKPYSVHYMSHDAGRAVYIAEHNTSQMHSSMRKENLFALEMERIFTKAGVKIIRQLKVDDYIVDFCFPEYNLFVEYDEVYHERPKQKAQDARRDACVARHATLIRIKEGEESDGIGLVLNTIIKKIVSHNSSSCLCSTPSSVSG